MNYPFLSYAQNFEDVILWRALRDIKEGFYIDVGAGHPTTLSVTKAFYDEGWHGINIEPDQEMYKLLEIQRPRDTNLCVAAGPKAGVATFWHYDGLGIVANDPAVREIFEKQGFKGHAADLGQGTLNKILEMFPVPKGGIHFLKVDVEGYEAQVLAGLDLTRHRPWIVVVEATLPTTQIRSDHLWAHRLLENDYGFAYFDALNCWYVDLREHKDLAGVINLPPNIFDSFIKAP